MRWLALLLWGLALAAGAGGPERSYPIAEPTAAERRLLDYPPARGLRIERVESEARYDLVHAELSFADPYSGEAVATTVELYRTKAPGKRPLVLVLPPFRGQTTIDRNFAQYFAENGLHAAEVLIPDDEYQRDQPLDYVNRFFVRNVVNLRMLLDQLARRPELRVDTERSAVLGLSLGGIRGSILFGLDPRLRAAVLVVAGAELPSLMSNSVLSPIQEWRDHNLFPDRHGLLSSWEESIVDERQEFERALRPVIEIEPSRYAANRDPTEVFIIRTSGDSYVPTANQDALVAAYTHGGESPHLLETDPITGGHYPTILYAYWQREQILAFLRRRLGMADTPQVSRRSD